LSAIDIEEQMLIFQQLEATTKEIKEEKKAKTKKNTKAKKLKKSESLQRNSNKIEISPER
jgi:phosphoenolpyruvate-protein kinase (PTS system EI component)